MRPLFLSGVPKTYTATTGGAVGALPPATGASIMIMKNLGVSDIAVAFGQSDIAAGAAVTDGADRSYIIPARTTEQVTLGYGYTHVAVAIASGGTNSDIQFQRAEGGL